MRRGHFVLASGATSDFFVDCKPTVLTAQGHHLVGELMLDALRHLPKCESVAGVALGGCPLASAVSLMSHIRGRPMAALYVRKEAKDHGTKNLIEGRLEPGMKVVMVEDVVTTGLSSREAIAAVAREGGEVIAEVALVDRSNGAADLGVPFFPLVDINFPTYAEGEVPAELAAIGVTKPGSRAA